MWAILAGAFLLICGLLYMVAEALGRRSLSKAPEPSANDPAQTLEPRRQGMRFLGLVRNWPGVALMAGGAALLLLAAV